jgi:hypothetical protein
MPSQVHKFRRKTKPNLNLTVPILLWFNVQFKIVVFQSSNNDCCVPMPMRDQREVTELGRQAVVAASIRTKIKRERERIPEGIGCY